jgi:2-dehydro-3-deoxyphosphogluconate aldolase/(4S)-4-hydroxy-2-oxoglutarate aldolase
MDLDKFKEFPVLGILRGITEIDLEPLISTIIDSGLETIEITLNTENALDLIRTAVKTSNGKLSIGAGTVLTKDAAKEAVNTGAEFIVTPALICEVTKFCKENKIPVFPGVLTPTEIYNAWQEGAAMVKVFPASVFGPKYFKELKGPFNNIKLMAVGGVTKENISDFFKNGADAAAFGASIFKQEWLAKKDFASIKKELDNFVASAKIAISLEK